MSMNHVERNFEITFRPGDGLLEKSSSKTYKGGNLNCSEAAVTALAAAVASLTMADVTLSDVAVIDRSVVAISSEDEPEENPEDNPESEVA